MTAIILDTETTDKENGEVIELAWVEVTPPPHLDISGYLTIDRFKPSTPSKFGALAVHHILPEELDDKPPSSKAAMPECDYLIGHNIDFDWKALGSPRSVNRICTLALARYLWPQIDSHTQTALMYWIRGANQQTRDLLRSAHTAGADVLMCRQILAAIVDQLKITTFAELWAKSEEARVPRVMTFGKFKDQPISAVDRGYSNWYRRQPDPDPYLLEAFRRAGI